MRGLDYPGFIYCKGSVQGNADLRHNWLYPLPTVGARKCGTYIILTAKGRRYEKCGLNYADSILSKGMVLGNAGFKLSKGQALENTGLILHRLHSQLKAGARKWDYVDYISTRRPAPESVYSDCIYSRKLEEGNAGFRFSWIYSLLKAGPWKCGAMTLVNVCLAEGPRDFFFFFFVFFLLLSFIRLLCLIGYLLLL